MSVKFPVRCSDSSVEDLEKIIAYYSEQDVPDVGPRLVAEIIKKIERLSDHPEMRGMVLEFDLKNLRELIHPPFRIVYRFDARHIRIFRVWRSERILVLPEED